MQKAIVRKIKFRLNLIYNDLIKPNHVQINGVKLYIDKNKFADKVIHSFYSGRYEQRGIDILESTLNPNDRYLEIGAGVGYMGINAARIVKDNDQIFLFEANPELIEIINKNTELNGQELSIFNKAIISGSDEEIPFYLTDDFWISSTIKKKNTNKIVVDALSLESTLKKHKPTYLMIDVEGGEYDLFINSEINKSVRKICLEIHPKFISSEKITKIFEVLINEGFTVDFNLSGNIFYYMYR